MRPESPRFAGSLRHRLARVHESAAVLVGRGTTGSGGRVASRPGRRRGEGLPPESSPLRLAAVCAALAMLLGASYAFALCPARSARVCRFGAEMIALPVPHWRARA